MTGRYPFIQHQKLGAGIDHQFLRVAVDFYTNRRPPIAREQRGSHSAGGRLAVQYEPPVAIIQQVVMAHEPRLAQHPVDAAGTQAAIDEAVARLAPGATLAVVSTWWDPVQFGFGLLSKEATVVPATIYGMRNGRREFDDAVDVLAANPVIADVLVTHRFGLDDAPEAFATAGNRAAGAIKVIIQP